jgi:hypothetical protein
VKAARDGTHAGSLRRTAAWVGGSDDDAWLDSDATRAVTCDAVITSVVTGDVDTGVLDDLVKLCVQLDRLDHATDQAEPAHQRQSLRPAVLLPPPDRHPPLGLDLVLDPDGTTTAWNPDRTKVLVLAGFPGRAVRAGGSRVGR